MVCFPRCFAAHFSFLDSSHLHFLVRTSSYASYFKHVFLHKTSSHLVLVGTQTTSKHVSLHKTSSHLVLVGTQAISKHVSLHKTSSHLVLVGTQAISKHVHLYKTASHLVLVRDVLLVEGIETNKLEALGHYVERLVGSLGNYGNLIRANLKK